MHLDHTVLASYHSFHSLSEVMFPVPMLKTNKQTKKNKSCLDKNSGNFYRLPSQSYEVDILLTTILNTNSIQPS